MSTDNPAHDFIGQTIAAKIIPPGTRRYGLHYILTGEEGLAIAASIEAAN